VLAEPVDGQVFSVRDPISLIWLPVGQLGPDEYYVATVTYLHLGESWRDEPVWTKQTQWALSDHQYLLDLSDDGRFRWEVQVMRETGIDDEGRQQGVPVSLPSEARKLVWQAPSGVRERGTPAPPEP
jgi:hypothetical protein